MKNKILLTLGILSLSSCTSTNIHKPEDTSYKLQSKIAMQRVKDTNPLAKQDLVSREAMQYAMLDKMNVRESRQRREFSRIQEQQRKDFLQIQQETTGKFDELTQKFADSSDQFAKTAKSTQTKLDNSVAGFEARTDALENRFRMIATSVEENSKMQSKFFEDMKVSYENKLAFDQARLDREKEKENTIRGVIDNMYDQQDKAIEQFYVYSKEDMLPPSQWVALEEAPLIVHVEDEKFEDLLLRSLNRASVHSGPWQLKWKLAKENENLLFTKFSLDAETTFGQFVNNVKAYILNYNGVQLQFRLFKEKRVLIVSDS
ncbi:MAG: hypothetical protein CFH44_00796 [Proteobacteria bacterium]|nr:MAG: hypothetical protein CFH44_00796 [Pseudomonadota bacterium]